MRNLQFGDIFTMSKIAKKLGIKVNIKDKSQEELGAELIMQTIENLYLAEKEIIKFFADLKGVSEEEITKMQPMELFKEFGEINGFQAYTARQIHDTEVIDLLLSRYGY